VKGEQTLARAPNFVVHICRTPRGNAAQFRPRFIFARGVHPSLSLILCPGGAIWSRTFSSSSPSRKLDVFTVYSIMVAHTYDCFFGRSEIEYTCFLQTNALKVCFTYKTLTKITFTFYWSLGKYTKVTFCLRRDT
jgi:hypothetical protein